MNTPTGAQPSTPLQVDLPTMEALKPLLEPVLAHLNLTEDSALRAHLLCFSDHDYQPTEIDIMAVTISLAAQNTLLAQKVHSLTVQLELFVNQTSGLFAKVNSTLSHVPASVASLDQTVGMAQTPNNAPLLPNPLSHALRSPL